MSTVHLLTQFNKLKTVECEMWHNKYLTSQKEIESLTAQLAQANERNEKMREALKRVDDCLSNGRSFLMGVEPEALTVEDTLEAFGFGRKGLKFPAVIE